MPVPASAQPSKPVTVSVSTVVLTFHWFDSSARPAVFVVFVPVRAVIVTSSPLITRQ